MRAFGAQGAAVVVNYRSRPEQAVDQIRNAGGRAVAVHTVVTDPDDVSALVQSAVREFGRLDVMVNNAGLEDKMPFLETPLDVWDKVVAVNLTGPFLGCREAAKHMVSQGGQGRILNLSGVHEDLPMPTNSSYCAAAKGGRQDAHAHDSRRARPHGITVNNIAPGAVDTEMDAGIKEHPDQMQEPLSEIPAGRMGKPEEIAAMAAYLASDAAAYVTGSTFLIDGGMSRQSRSL